MSIFLGLIILVNIASLIFLIISVGRLYVYIKKFDLKESEYTLLFRRFRLRYLVSLYILFIATHVSTSTYIALIV